MIREMQEAENKDLFRNQSSNRRQRGSI